MHKWTKQEIQLHIRAVALLILSMIAVAMVAEVSAQNWNSKVTAYPTKTEAAIERYARDLMNEMSLEELVGQMFYAVDPDDVEGDAEQYGFGGVLLSAEHFNHLSAGEVSAVLSGYQTSSRLPLLIGVAEEGGDVNAVSIHSALRSKEFLSPGELVTTGGMKFVDHDARDKSDLLRSLGIRVNFAPVCEATTDKTAAMYSRTVHGDTDDAVRYVATVVAAMTERKVQPVLKYFPGYGNVKYRSDTEVLTDSRSYEQLQQQALPPFARGIEEGAKMVMMSNNIVMAVDSSQPASLSRDVHDLLRRDMGFEGLIISGELHAKGLQRYGSVGEIAVQAIRAGSDMLVTKDYRIQIPAVVHAVQVGELSRERIEESVLRILKLKIEMGLME